MPCWPSNARELLIKLPPIAKVLAWGGPPGELPAGDHTSIQPLGPTTTFPSTIKCCGAYSSMNSSVPAFTFKLPVTWTVFSTTGS